jgi:hypothetical protein
MKFKCIKEGKMDDGRIFAYKGDIYEGFIEPDEDPEEEMYIEIKDELWDERFRIYHGMDEEFFNEYFEVLNENVDD